MQELHLQALQASGPAHVKVTGWLQSEGSTEAQNSTVLHPSHELTACSRPANADLKGVPSRLSKAVLQQRRAQISATLHRPRRQHDSSGANRSGNKTDASTLQPLQCTADSNTSVLGPEMHAPSTDLTGHHTCSNEAHAHPQLPRKAGHLVRSGSDCI